MPTREPHASSHTPAQRHRFCGHFCTHGVAKLTNVLTSNVAAVSAQDTLAAEASRSSQHLEAEVRRAEDKIKAQEVEISRLRASLRSLGTASKQVIITACNSMRCSCACAHIVCLCSKHSSCMRNARTYCACAAAHTR
jgi:hypothetical protein